MVTILFADVAGSTAVGEQLDPESLRRVMARHFDEIQGIVAEHGGVVEKFIGDAVMAVFGVPRVHEDDALRAVRSAIAIRDRLAELEAEGRDQLGVSIAWRIGVNTGEVVAGDAGGGQRFVSGDAVNLAKRLEESAGIGEVLIGAATRRLVRDAVDAEPVDRLTVKGKAEPVEAYRLLGVSDAPTGQARRVDGPMVGRGRQRRLLADAFGQAEAERACHLFTILGAPGVGKSRLVAEFLAGLEGEVTALRGRCLSYGQGITYWPIREMLHAAAGVTDDDATEVVRAKVGALLDGSDDAERIADGLAGAIGLGGADVPSEEIAWAVRRLFETLARRRPLVVVFDDVHWAEPTLLDLIESIADWANDAPILLVCIGRHDLLDQRPQWGGGKLAATTIRLEPLTSDEAEELVGELVGNAKLDASVKHRIAEAADGNPLFVEELLAMLIDDGALVRQNGDWEAAADLATMAVPPTMQALLAARLDRLARPERTVMECGAVEGKVFHAGAVAALVPEPERDQVPQHLRTLMRKELLRPHEAEFSGDQAFRFRHLLIRDAAYQAMPKSARADLHERFADWLEAAVGERRVEYEEILGHHLEQAYRYRSELAMPDADVASLAHRAGDYLASSGERAADRGDLHAALRLLDRALELLGDDHARAPRLHTRLAEARLMSSEPRRARQHAETAIEISRRRGDEAGAAAGEVALISVENSMGHSESSAVLVRAEQLAAVLDEAGDVRGWAAATLLVGQHLFFTGRTTESLRRLTEALERLPPGSRDRARLAWWTIPCLRWGPTPVDEAIAATERVIVENPGSRVIESMALRHRGGLQAMRGEFDEGRALMDRAKAVALEMGQILMAESTDGHFRTSLELLAGNPADAAEIGQHSFEVMRASGDQAFASTVAGIVGVALAELGQWDQAERYGRLALEMSAADDDESQALGRQVIARVHMHRGELAAAEQVASEAVAIRARGEFIDQHADALLVLAEVLHANGRRSDAREALSQALELYRRKGNIVSARRTEELLAPPTS